MIEKFMALPMPVKFLIVGVVVIGVIAIIGNIAT